MTLEIVGIMPYQRQFNLTVSYERESMKKDRFKKYGFVMLVGALIGQWIDVFGLTFDYNIGSFEFLCTKIFLLFIFGFLMPDFYKEKAKFPCHNS